MNTGSEWLVDAAGCNRERLADIFVVRAVCDAIIADLELRVVGQAAWNEFPPPGGVTGLYLLTESHLACHTFPESGQAVFNLYCCRSRPRWTWETVLADRLGATAVVVQEIPRGLRFEVQAFAGTGRVLQFSDMESPE